MIDNHKISESNVDLGLVVGRFPLYSWFQESFFASILVVLHHVVIITAVLGTLMLNKEYFIRYS